MPETRSTAVAIPTDAAQTDAVLQSTTNVVSRAAAWARDTAQKFGALLAALMGPAVFSAYAFACWSLAADLGWTDTFLFTTGPLSNWLVWLGIAILVTLAASVLKRHTALEQ
jgi:hypothetical protein